MYKIYVNDRPLWLCEEHTAEALTGQYSRLLSTPYFGKAKVLKNYIDMLEKASPKVNGVILYTPETEKLKRDFFDYYRLVEAAGGLVRNALGEVLFIFRRGHWDLPKGKIEPGETREEAATREVSEETGLTGLVADDFITTTYHTYRDDKNRRVLKPTYWFRMFTVCTDLQLQHEEDIEKAEWLPVESFLAQNYRTYPSIIDVLEKDARKMAI